MVIQSGFTKYEATEITEDTERGNRMAVLNRFLSELSVLGGYGFR
jgi:hypothetical protein